LFVAQYYTKGAGKWCSKKFELKKIQINASDTSGASSTSGTNETIGRC